MKKHGLLSCLALIATLLAPCTGVAAETGAKPFYSERTVIAERSFGELRFVMGAGQAMKWLEMYTGSNLIAAFRDFDAQDVIASPDQEYFLAISNTRSSPFAFAVLDRAGQIVFSSPHGSDLHYCEQTPRTRYWIDAREVKAKFAMEKGLQGPAQFLSVTVRGCDGRETPLPQAAHSRGSDNRNRSADNSRFGGVPEVITTGTRIAIPATAGQTTDSGTADRASFFLGDTIKNLRGLDPTFGNRTLTLVDGRRKLPTAAPVEDTATAAPQVAEESAGK